MFPLDLQLERFKSQALTAVMGPQGKHLPELYLEQGLQDEESRGKQVQGRHWSPSPAVPEAHPTALFMKQQIPHLLLSDLDVVAAESVPPDTADRAKKEYFVFSYFENDMGRRKKF